jgi:hypothetical protein
MDYRLAYGASSDLTITLASLATSADLLVGRESTLVDNSTNAYLDYLLAGYVTTGTSPSAGTRIQVCVVGMLNDTEWPDVFDGTDSGETITAVGIKNAVVRVAADITVDNNNNRAYPFGPVSVASLFGGAMPKKFSVFVTQSTTVNLNSTAGNHKISVTPIYAELTA